MVSCSACSCIRRRKNKNPGISFHRFPKKVEIRDKWIKFVKRANWKPNSFSVLCSQHFTEECFDRSSQLIVRLHPNSVPTVEVLQLEYIGNNIRSRSKKLSAKIENGCHVSTSSPRSSSPAEEEVTSNLLDKIESNNNCDMSTSRSSSLLIQSATPQRIKLGSNNLLKENSRERLMIAKIQDLSRKDILKSAKIRELQKIVYYQKTQILSLKARMNKMNKIVALKEEKGSILLEHW